MSNLTTDDGLLAVDKRKYDSKADDTDGIRKRMEERLKATREEIEQNAKKKKKSNKRVVKLKSNKAGY